jgi:hypothetical protein
MLARRLGEASEILLLLARKDPACEEGSRALHSAQLQLVTGGSLSLLTLCLIKEICCLQTHAREMGRSGVNTGGNVLKDPL